AHHQDAVGPRWQAGQGDVRVPRPEQATLRGEEMTTDELIRDYTNARINAANGYGPARTAAYKAEAHRLGLALAARVEHLERRLTDGEARIAEAESQGHDTRKWEEIGR